MGDHSSADCPCGQPQATNPGGRAEPGPAEPKPRAPPLFGLAPGGVYRAARRCRGRGALLPHPFTVHAAEAQSPKADVTCSLLHCPWGRPRRTLSGTMVSWSPDFPRHRKAKPRSPDRLARGGYREARGGSHPPSSGRNARRWRTVMAVTGEWRYGALDRRGDRYSLRRARSAARILSMNGRLRSDRSIRHSAS